MQLGDHDLTLVKNEAETAVTVVMTNSETSELEAHPVVLKLAGAGRLAIELPGVSDAYCINNGSHTFPDGSITNG